MANLLVFIDVREGRPTPPSRFAVSEARRIANELGGTVYALLTLGPVEHEMVEALARDLGRDGADRVLCCADVALAGGALDVFVGPLIESVAERLRPLLSLFPAGGAGPELGAPLAVRTGATYHPHASLELEPPPEERRSSAINAPRLRLRRWRASHDGLRSIDAHDLDRPVVVTLAAGLVPGPRGHEDVEVDMLSPPDTSASGAREISSEPDDDAALALVSSIIWVQTPAPADAIEAIRAASPPQMAVVISGVGARTAALEAACPAQLLVFARDGAGVTSLPPVPIAASTRVAIAAGKEIDKAPAPVELVWKVTKDDGLATLAEALRRNPTYHGDGET